MRANDVFEQAFGASDAERPNLAEQLLESVNQEQSAIEEFVLEQDFSLELQRRLDEMDRGVGVRHDAWESLDRIRLTR